MYNNQDKHKNTNLKNKQILVQLTGTIRNVWSLLYEACMWLYWPST